MSNNGPTLVSVSTGDGESEQTPDARKSPRTLTILKTVKVQRSDEEGLAILQNLSDEGMKLSLGLSVCLGDEVVVHLSDLDWVHATVVWTAGANCGLRLIEPINSAALLSGMAERAREGSSRPVRMTTKAPGVAYSEGAVHPIEVKDISQRGLKIQHRAHFAEGMPVKIRLISGLELSGTVRWSQGDVAGIELLTPVSVEDLGSSKLV